MQENWRMAAFMSTIRMILIGAKSEQLGKSDLLEKQMRKQRLPGLGMGQVLKRTSIPNSNAAPTVASEAAPVAYGTPYKQLSRKAHNELQEKVANRTITKEEWKRLSWNERLTDRRQAGIDDL
jgi:hypothetical protein